jgi:hypothetical protein
MIYFSPLWEASACAELARKEEGRRKEVKMLNHHASSIQPTPLNDDDEGLEV